MEGMESTLTFTNLSPDLQWTDYHNLFEKFGKIVKLYIHPQAEFGKVKFANPTDAKRAHQQVNDQPPLHLLIEAPTESSLICKSSNNSTSIMNRRSHNNSYYDNNGIDDEVDVLPSQHTYVDIYGRPLDTLELEDGSEVYVPVSELKRSGFEIYTKDSLPKRGGNSVVDKKLLEQFEMYLKVKAVKFMKEHNLSFPEETINNSIKRLKTDCLGNSLDERVVSPTYNNRNKNVGNQQRERRNFPNRGQKFNDYKAGSPHNDNKNNDWSAQRNYSNKLQGKNESLRRPAESPFSKTLLNKNKPEEVKIVHLETESIVWVQLTHNLLLINEIMCKTMEAAPRAAGLQAAVNRMCAALFRGVWYRAVIVSTLPLTVQFVDFGHVLTEEIDELRELPDELSQIPWQAVRIRVEYGLCVKLKPFVVLTVMATMKEEDGTFSVSVSSQNSEVKNTPPSKPLQETPPMTPKAEDKLRLPKMEEASSPSPKKGETTSGSESTPKTVKFSESIAEALEKSLKKPEVEPQPVPLSIRRTAIEKESDSGIFNCVKVVDNETMIGVAMPVTCVEVLGELDDLATVCVPDASFKPCVGDIVAVPNESDEEAAEISFVRGLVCSVNNSQYSCALVDYGTMTTVCEARRLPEKYATIPEFACLFKASPLVIKEISESSQLQMTVSKPLHVTLFLSSGKTVDIVGSLWNPIQKTPQLNLKEPERLNMDKNASNVNLPPKEEIFLLPKPAYQLKSGDLVILALEMEGKLHVRTRECDIILKQVIPELEKYQGKSLTKPPVVDQLVVCPFDDGVLYRAVILSIAGNSALVEYIDYGNVEKVSLTSMQEINEKLATAPNTIIKITLDNFDTPFSSKALEFLHDCAEQRKRFTVTLLHGDKFKLVFKDGTSLTDKLKSLDERQKSDERIVLEDIKKCNFSLGSNNALCVYCEELEEGTASFCYADVETSEKLLTLGTSVAAHAQQDNNHYSPESLEVCVAKFDDEWYRAVCVRKYENGTFGMFYIDYGNTKIVSTEHIRKLPKELANVERMSALCVLEGVAQPGEKVAEPLLSKLKAAIRECETYTINVLKEGVGCYHITIPSLFDEWRREGLMA